MSKIGRNEPCPCGSGRKYKQCCLAASAGPADLAWHRLRQATEPLVADLLAFSRREHYAGLIEEAWSEFAFETVGPFAAETVHMSVFFAWFFYEWQPDPVDTAVPAHRLGEFPLAAAFLARRPRIDPLAARYVEACLEWPFSFFEVVTCTPGTGFALRDLLTGVEHDVTERSASQGARPCDILFAKLAAVDHLTVLDGCGPALIPPAEKAAIIPLRRLLRRGRRAITVDLLREFDIEVREVYIEITERLLHARRPQLQNTDGEQLSFHRLTWDVPSARAAFDDLAPLAMRTETPELPDDAAVSASGELEAVAFPWLREGNAKHPSWTNTVLGTLRLDGRRLTLEVNSADRARLGRMLVDEAVPGAIHRSTVVESVEAALAAHRAMPVTEREARDREAEALRRDPEVQAQMTAMLRQHYRGWVDERLPALGGKSPRQAMRTRDGREMVEALLVGLERRENDDLMPLESSIIAELRDTLNTAIPRGGSRQRRVAVAAVGPITVSRSSTASETAHEVV